MRHVIVLGKVVAKQLMAAPRHIVRKFQAWTELVEGRGMMEARKIPGYHDEPLKGERHGQRSVRLSRSYRAIYSLSADGSVEIVTVVEVTKHDY
jgi:proteic killer suppression protein